MLQVTILKSKHTRLIIVATLALLLIVPLDALARGGGRGGGGRGGGGRGGGGFGGGRGGGGHFGGGGRGGGGHFGGGGRGGGFGGGGHFGGGGRGGGFGGGGRFAGGGIGGGNRGGGFGGIGGRDHNFGGGFNGIASSRPIGGRGDRNFGDRGGFGDRNFGDRGGRLSDRDRGGRFGDRELGDRGGRLGDRGGRFGDREFGNRLADGGFSSLAERAHNRPHHINREHLHHQGDNIRHAFHEHHGEFHHLHDDWHGGWHGDDWHGGYGWGHGYGYGLARGVASGVVNRFWGYPGAWGCYGLSQASMWAWTGVNILSSFLGLGASADDDDYSPTNVTYEGDTVYINGQPSGSSEQYYQQAQELAARAQQQNYGAPQNNYGAPPQNYGAPTQNYVFAPGQNFVPPLAPSYASAPGQNFVPVPAPNYASAPIQNYNSAPAQYAFAPGQNFIPAPAPNYAGVPEQNIASVPQQNNAPQTGAPQQSSDPNEQWQPLGVFALAAPGQDQSDMLLQLAINSGGTIRGNYLNNLTSETSQVYGTLDKKSQRVSWTVGTNLNTVFDTSLSDLTKDNSEVLVHYGPTNTRQMALIRLPAPGEPTEGQSKTSMQ